MLSLDCSSLPSRAYSHTPRKKSNSYLHCFLLLILACQPSTLITESQASVCGPARSVASATAAPPTPGAPAAAHIEPTSQCPGNMDSPKRLKAKTNGTVTSVAMVPCREPTMTAAPNRPALMSDVVHASPNAKSRTSAVSILSTSESV